MRSQDVVSSCADPQAAGRFGWWLCFISVASGHKTQRKCKPKYILVHGRMGCFPLMSLVLSKLPAGPELSEKSELIVTLWVAF